MRAKGGRITELIKRPKYTAERGNEESDNSDPGTTSPSERGGEERRGEERNWFFDRYEEARRKEEEEGTRTMNECLAGGC